MVAADAATSAARQDQSHTRLDLTGLQIDPDRLVQVFRSAAATEDVKPLLEMQDGAIDRHFRGSKVVAAFERLTHKAMQTFSDEMPGELAFLDEGSPLRNYIESHSTGAQIARLFHTCNHVLGVAAALPGTDRKRQAIQLLNLGRDERQCLPGTIERIEGNLFDVMGHDPMVMQAYQKARSELITQISRQYPGESWQVHYLQYALWKAGIYRDGGHYQDRVLETMPAGKGGNFVGLGQRWFKGTLLPTLAGMVTECANGPLQAALKAFEALGDGTSTIDLGAIERFQEEHAALLRMCYPGGVLLQQEPLYDDMFTRAKPGRLLAQFVRTIVPYLSEQSRVDLFDDNRSALVEDFLPALERLAEDLASGKSTIHESEMPGIARAIEDPAIPDGRRNELVTDTLLPALQERVTAVLNLPPGEAFESQRAKLEASVDALPAVIRDRMQWEIRLYFQSQGYVKVVEALRMLATGVEAPPWKLSEDALTTLQQWSRDIDPEDLAQLFKRSFAAPLKAWAKACLNAETPAECKEQIAKALAVVDGWAERLPQIEATARTALQFRQTELASLRLKELRRTVDAVAKELEARGTSILAPDLVQALWAVLDDPWTTDVEKSTALRQLVPAYETWASRNLSRTTMRQRPDHAPMVLASFSDLPPDVQRIASHAAVSRLARRTDAARVIEQYLKWQPAPSAFPPAVGHPEPPPEDLRALLDRCRSLDALDDSQKAALREEIAGWRGEREGTVLHWAATHAMGAEIVDAIAPLFEDEKDRRLVQQRPHRCARQDQDSEYRYRNRGGFGRFSLEVDAENRLPLSRATDPDFVRAMCRHGADPCDDAFTWVYLPWGHDQWDKSTYPKLGIRPALCFVEHPAIFETMVECMGAEVEITPYQLEQAATPLAIRLMCERYPSVMDWAEDQGQHPSARRSIRSRPKRAGMPVSHYADPALTKTLLVCLREHLEASQNSANPIPVLDRMRKVFDRGTMRYHENLSMPLRCPSLESAKMICAWRCVHSKDDRDWLQWSETLKSELDNRENHTAFGRSRLKAFLDVLTATRPALALELDTAGP